MTHPLRLPPLLIRSFLIFQVQDQGLLFSSLAHFPRSSSFFFHLGPWPANTRSRPCTNSLFLHRAFYSVWIFRTLSGHGGQLCAAIPGYWSWVFCVPEFLFYLPLRIFIGVQLGVRGQWSGIACGSPLSGGRGAIKSALALAVPVCGYWR